MGVMTQIADRTSLRNSFILFLLLCLTPTVAAAAQALPIQVRFDRRVELISIIFYLAGNKEYAGCRDAAYLKEVDEYFGKYRSHPAVKMAAELRERKHVWFGSPISFAVHLTPDDQLLPGTRDHSHGGTLDFRWSLAEAQSFAGQVRSFARASRAQSFFKQHEPLYRQMTGRLKRLVAHIDAAWFASLTAARSTRTFTVSPSLLLGGGNFGPHVQADGRFHNYAIMGVWKFEKDGSPTFGEDSAWVIIHEFAHSYVNPWVDEGMGQLRPAAEKLIKARQHDFDKTGYGQGTKFNPDLLYETMVRALVVVYFADHGDATGAQQQLEKDVTHGWSWLPDVVDWVKSARARGHFRLDEAAREDYSNLLTALAKKG
jgi:Domain of unknown function (DUF4932)